MVSRGLTLAWTLAVVALLGHQGALWRGGLPVETDLLALLPRDARDDVAERALEHLAQATARQVVVLVGAATREAAAAGADAFARAVLPGRLVATAAPENEPEALVAALAPYRGNLVTAGGGTAAQALALLHQPMGLSVGRVTEDPLQRLAAWLTARAAATRVQAVDGRLTLEADGRHHVLLTWEVAGSAFSLDGATPVADALAAGRAAVPAGVEVLAAGVPLFAEAAAAQASGEVSTVGLGSLLAILLVMWLAFRSPLPLGLVVLSVGLGVAAGLSACVLVFGRVHLITLVFGASLVGVAEDYGIHYFASRQAHPARERVALLRGLVPGLLLAMVTSVVGYLMLALAPLPGLRQVALFSGVGLAAAFLTVLAWFPSLDRGAVRSTAFARAWAGTRRWWPTGRGAQAAVAALGLLGLAASTRLAVDDDVRALQASPPSLVAAQREAARRLGLPSPAQFFVVRGADEGEVLAREEALTAQLDALVQAGALVGYQAVSSWVPSPARQREQHRRFVEERAAVLAGLSQALEEALEAPPEAFTPLTVATLLATPAGAPLRPLWMEGASVVLLQGLSLEGLARVAAVGGEGVRFVDRTGELSQVLGAWRRGMGWLLLVGYAVILATLGARFRGRAWRALAPTAVAMAVALGAVALLGEPLSLFHVLALWLLLGIGVDYGIFLLEHPSSDAGEAWLAVGLGAASTLLSFGLLAVSKTPAIHAFGVTLGVGVAVVWAVAPVLARPPR